MELRIQVKKLDDFVRVNEWIVVCIILHNILLSFKDEWDDYDLEEEDNDTNGVIIDTNGGENLSEAVQLKLLNWYNSTSKYS
jgi:hypothetical protein